MAENSKIEWTDHTFNPWRGCTKVAAGCANCYADAQAKRNPGTLGIWGPNGTRVVASEEMWKQPLKWDREAILRCSNCGQSTKGERLVKGANPLDVGYDFQCIGCDSEKYIAHRPRVFCASMADVFEDWKGQVVDSQGRQLFVHDCEPNPEPHRFVPMRDDLMPHERENLANGMFRPLTLDDVRARLFSQIDETPNLDRLLLTKRPENIPKMWPEIACEYCSDSSCSVHRAGVIDRLHRKNVWLGTSIACQADADKNIPELLKCRDLAPVLFLSIEPLVGPVDLTRLLIKPSTAEQRQRGKPDVTFSTFKAWQFDYQDSIGIDWIIVGGESGPNARPCNVEWIRSIVTQCKAAGVPCFVKQLGAVPVFDDYNASQEWPKGVYFESPEDNEPEGPNIAILEDKKGGDWSEWPEDLKVREFPEVNPCG